MKVYIVIELEKYEGTTVIAVYDTLEKADDYIKNHQNKKKPDYLFSLYVEEFELNNGEGYDPHRR